MKSIEEFSTDVYARADKMKRERVVKSNYIRRYSSLAAMIAIVIISVFAFRHIDFSSGNDIDPALFSIEGRDGTSGENTSITSTTPARTTTTPVYTTTTPRFTDTKITPTTVNSTVTYTLSSASGKDSSCAVIKNSTALSEWINMNISKDDGSDILALTAEFDEEYFKTSSVVACLINKDDIDETMSFSVDFGGGINCTVCIGAPSEEIFKNIPAYVVFIGCNTAVSTVELITQ